MPEHKPRPFHETIVEALRRVNLRSLEPISFLLETTAVPRNHDEIVAAWRRACLHIGIGEEETERVAALVLAQKHKEERPRPLCL